MASRWITAGRGKRVLDLCLAVPAAVILAPVGAVVALVVRRQLGSPVVFRQRRAGLHGDAFDVVKFRSMTDERGPDGELLADEERLGRFGASLRATSLDELPQLWNVIKGDMSLIGPRPLYLRYIERYSAEQRRRLEAKPGITGWAQVNGRNASSWPERLAHDVWYVDHASLRLDLRILAMTIGGALRRHGVAADDHVTMREFAGEE